LASVKKAVIEGNVMDKKTFISKTTRLVGKTYRSVEDMPPDVRQAYEQVMASSEAMAESSDSSPADKIIIDGKEYASAEEMPPEVRRSYEQMRAITAETTENPETAEVTEIIVNDKKYASVEEMPLDLRRTYLQAMAASSESPGSSLKKILSGLPTRQRTITIIEDRSANAENADDDAEKPGLGWFLAILAGFTVLYLMYLLIPGRHEPMEKFLARQPTWGGFFRGWAFIVLPISSFLWLGFYIFRGQFSDAISLASKILLVALVLLIIAMILSALVW
jgi:hypothetical protein